MVKSAYLALIAITVLSMLLCPQNSLAKTVNESARDIPVVYDVDVAVIGGSSAAVAVQPGTNMPEDLYKDWIVNLGDITVFAESWMMN